MDVKYKALFELLRKKILGGEYRVGDALPSMRALISRYAVSKTTVQRALDELVNQGFVLRKQGCGTFIANAASLRKIGLIVPGVANSEFYPKMVGEISQCLRAREYTLVYEDVNADGRRASWSMIKPSVDGLVASGVSGVLFQPFPDETSGVNRKVLAAFEHARVPVVLLNRNVLSTNGETCCDCVGIDNFDAGRRVGEHLVSCGCRKIAFILKPDVSTVRDRMRGLIIASQEGRARLKVYRSAKGAECVRKIMTTFRPDAIVCGNDELARTVANSLKELKARIPEDVNLVGFDDIRYARDTVPSLTSVRQPCADIAMMAVSRLITRIKTPRLPPVSINLSSKLVFRDSTGATCRSGKDRTASRITGKTKGKRNEL